MNFRERAGSRWRRHEGAPVSSKAKQENDSALIAACLAGNDRAWERLVERYSPLVFSIALRYGLDQNDAADVHWRTWETLWEDLPRLRDRERLGPWLVTVTARLAWHHNEVHRRLPTEQLADPDTYGLADPAPAPEDVVLQIDRVEQLRTAIETLPERCQRLLTMLFLDPTAPSYEQIAAELNIARDSIGSYRHRCLKRLRAALEALE